MLRCDPSVHHPLRLGQIHFVRLMLHSTALFYQLTLAFRYMFLLELVHVVRAPFVERRRDPIFILGGIIIGAGTIILLIWENINPISTLSRVNGICYIGIQRGPVIFLLTFDIAINFILTAMFVWQLRPSNTAVHGTIPHLSPASKRRISRVLQPFQSKERPRPSTIRSKASQASLRRMIWRTIFGSTLVLVATTINCIMFISWRNSHMGHACLLLCLSDGKCACLRSHVILMLHPSRHRNACVKLPHDANGQNKEHNESQRS
jgi:hypothetical protein